MAIFNVLRARRYLRLKIWVTIIRFLAGSNGRRVSRRERVLFNQVEPRSVRIPSRDPGRFITANLYYPPGISPELPSSTERSKLPVVINWHGGGFVIPALGSDHPFCVRLAMEAGVAVLDAEYRKSPEVPFPGVVEDVEDSLRWIADRSDEFDTSSVVPAGFSAGGNLALVAASSLRQDLAEKIKIPAVIAVYPATDLTLAPEVKVIPKPLKLIPAPLTRIFGDSYVPDMARRSDPRVSVGLADPSAFPETVIIVTVEGDNLHPEANALAVKLDDGTRKVVNWMIPDAHHSFDKGCQEGSKEWQQRDIAYSRIIHELKGALDL
jgi:acetyl esterase/lipase